MKNLVTWKNLLKHVIDSFFELNFTSKAIVTLDILIEIIKNNFGALLKKINPIKADKIS